MIWLSFVIVQEKLSTEKKLLIIHIIISEIATGPAWATALSHEIRIRTWTLIWGNPHKIQSLSDLEVAEPSIFNNKHASKVVCLCKTLLMYNQNYNSFSNVTSCRWNCKSIDIANRNCLQREPSFQTPSWWTYTPRPIRMSKLVTRTPPVLLPRSHHLIAGDIFHELCWSRRPPLSPFWEFPSMKRTQMKIVISCLPPYTFVRLILCYFTYLSASISVVVCLPKAPCQAVCFSACRPVCLLTWLITCLPACLNDWLTVCLHVCLIACTPVWLYAACLNPVIEKEEENIRKENKSIDCSFEVSIELRRQKGHVAVVSQSKVWVRRWG